MSASEYARGLYWNGPSPLTIATSVLVWGNGLKVVWYSTLLHSGSLCRHATFLASPAVGRALRALQRTAVEQTCGTD